MATFSLSFVHSKMFKAVVYGLVLCAMVLGLSLAPAGAKVAQAAEWCVNGISYHDAGTSHNYVKFQVNFSAQNWVVRHNWKSSVFPATLWAFPDSSGVAKAGITRTDRNPPYSPSNYRLCGWW